MNDLSKLAAWGLKGITRDFDLDGGALLEQRYRDVLAWSAPQGEHEKALNELKALGFEVALVHVLLGNPEASGYFIRFSHYPEWFTQRRPRPVVIDREDLKEVLRRLYAELGQQSSVDEPFVPWAGSNGDELEMFKRVFNALK